jgi:hypothetical protein
MYLVPFNSISYPLFMRISNSMSEQEEKSATHANDIIKEKKTHK